MKKFILTVAMFLGLVIILAACAPKVTVLKPEDAKAKALKYINENLVSADNQVTIDEITDEAGLYKLGVKLQDGTVVDSYMTKDGKIFFPQSMKIEPDDAQGATNGATNQPSAEVKNKSDKPSVELFVMSHCPYGTQIEKGILPVLDLLKDKIDFKLKFCDYAMHGKTELDEQLVQTCIQKEQPDKLQAYLNCFLAAGDGSKCLGDAGIDKAKNTACVSATDKEFKVTENFNNKVDYQGQFPSFAVFAAENEQYGVGGSPTLVINGGQISSGRDPQSLLNVICSAFNKLPGECSQQLDSATPEPGFGAGTGSASADGGCASN